MAGDRGGYAVTRGRPSRVGLPATPVVTVTSVPEGQYVRSRAGRVVSSSFTGRWRSW